MGGYNSDIPLPNQRVKSIRKSLGMSQHDFSSRISIKQGSLSDIERGRLAVSERLAATIEDVFGVPKSWILTGEKDEKTNYNIAKIERMVSGALKFEDMPSVKFKDIAPEIFADINKMENDPKWEIAQNIQIELITKYHSDFKKLVPELNRFQSLIRQILQFNHSLDKYLFNSIRHEIYNDLKADNSSKEIVTNKHRNVLSQIPEVIPVLHKLNNDLNTIINKLSKHDINNTLSIERYNEYRELLLSMEFHKIVDYKEAYSVTKTYPDLQGT